MARLPPEALSERSRLIMTYAMCGFANFGSLGIMIGGMAGLVPERRAEIAGLGMKSIVAGTLATRSEEHTSELQSLMRISYAVFCLKKKKIKKKHLKTNQRIR